MATVQFSGQTLKFVGANTISISNTPLSASDNIRYIFAATATTSNAFLRYQVGLPDFLQGFTTFAPNSSYQFYIASTSVLPLSTGNSADFIPPIGAFAGVNAKMYSGLSFYLHTSGNPNLDSGAGFPYTAYNTLSTITKTLRILRPNYQTGSINASFAAYVPGNPPFLQGFTSFAEQSSYITFFKNNMLSSVSTNPLPLEIVAPASTPTQTPTRTVTRTATQTATPTSTRTITSTQTATVTKSSTTTRTPTQTATHTTTRTSTQTHTQTPTQTRTATQTQTATNTRTPTSSATAAVTPTQTPTNTVTNINSNINTNINTYSDKNTHTNPYTDKNSYSYKNIV